MLEMYATVNIARPEDRATRECDPSAGAGGHTARPGFGSAFFVLAASLVAPKAINSTSDHGGVASGIGVKDRRHGWSAAGAAFGFGAGAAPGASAAFFVAGGPSRRVKARAWSR